MLVRDVMTHEAEAIGPHETLEAAARRMKERGVGALLVADGERILGILTDRDIVVRAVAAGAEPAHAMVESAMTPQAMDCYADEELEGAAARMERGAVRRLVVVDLAGRPVGMLSVDDIALESPALAGEVIEHVRAPERPVERGGPIPWWETPAT
jgi:CBS domain-containing protein